MEYIVALLSAFSLLILFAPQYASAQEADLPFARHSAYIELGGSTSVYSLNYEYQLSRNLAVRIGAVSSPFGYRDAEMHGGLVGGSYLLGKGRHRIELGASVAAAFLRDNIRHRLLESESSRDGLGLSFSPIVGYRFQPMDSGLMVRLGLTPVLSITGPKFSQSPLKGGLSLGWKF